MLADTSRSHLTLSLTVNSQNVDGYYSWPWLSVLIKIMFSCEATSQAELPIDKACSCYNCVRVECGQAHVLWLISFQYWRKSAACDDSNQVWARFCCAWHVYDVVVGELFTYLLWSVIWVLHWLIQFHGYWLQNDRCQFHTENVYVEVLMKLVDLSWV